MMNKIQFFEWNTVISIEVNGNIAPFADRLKDKIVKLDSIFSQDKLGSEIFDFKEGQVAKSKELKEALELADYLKEITNGAFDHFRKIDGVVDLYALSKGYCVEQLVKILYDEFAHGGINAGGDIQVFSEDDIWKIGLEEPANRQEIFHTIEIANGAVCSSGNYLKDHIEEAKYDISTVVGPSAPLADGLATAIIRDPEGRWLPPSYQAILHNAASKVFYTLNSKIS